LKEIPRTILTVHCLTEH